jgi:hypothetical protein
MQSLQMANASPVDRLLLWTGGRRRGEEDYAVAAVAVVKGKYKIIREDRQAGFSGGVGGKGARHVARAVAGSGCTGGVPGRQEGSRRFSRESRGAWRRQFSH